MVKSVEVKNFKSIVDLKLELGRVNVFIGENGSGKSNILEAVAFGAAASDRKLDKEFLASRGIRVPEPKLMRSAFDIKNLDKDVSLSFKIDTLEIKYNLSNENKEFSIWEEWSNNLWDTMSNFGKFQAELLENPVKSSFKEGRKIIKGQLSPVISIPELPSHLQRHHSFLSKYKIYAPENTFLRKFEDEEAGDPLGIKGEGLFRLLRYFQNHENKSYIESINEALSALDWFESFDIPNGLYAGERRLSIIDRFLDTEVSISQNSANEGFLFILFYVSLFVSEDAPPFFAIDNVDASFNPKLCKHITQILVNTAKKTNKQALFTTHNPFILDGLDLTDDEQRLFVVYRTQKGHTVAKRIPPNDRKMKLSEQWMSGLLGGLPENF
jgi:predicted ATPase